MFIIRHHFLHRDDKRPVRRSWKRKKSPEIKKTLCGFGKVRIFAAVFSKRSFDPDR